jgi:hypothetical protein
MDVIECGREAKTKLGQKDALITAVCIRYEKITYELTYFNNGKFDTVWMHETEFILKEKNTKTKIGFDE